MWARLGGFYKSMAQNSDTLTNKIMVHVLKTGLRFIYRPKERALTTKLTTV
jgi:hypothetical protein